MKMLWRTGFLSAQAVGLSFLLMACGSPASQNDAPPPPQAQPQAPPPQAPPPQAQDKQYDLKGKVVGVDKEVKTVAVDGEEIPGFMGAMTMSYPIKDERLLETLRPGDQITAKVIASASEYWLENVAVVGK